MNSKPKKMAFTLLNLNNPSYLLPKNYEFEYSKGKP